MACLAQVALPVPLAFVMAIADHQGTVTVRTAHAIRPAMLTHKLEALRLVQQARKVDHVQYGHGCAASSNQPDHLFIRSDQRRSLGATLRSHHPETQQEPRWFSALLPGSVDSRPVGY